MVRVFDYGPGDQSSISGRVIPKPQKMVLDTSLLNTQDYKVRIKGMWINPGKGELLSPTPRCSSYSKREPSPIGQLNNKNINTGYDRNTFQILKSSLV